MENASSGGVRIIEGATGRNLVIGTVDGISGIYSGPAANAGLDSIAVETNDGDLTVNGAVKSVLGKIFLRAQIDLASGTIDAGSNFVFLADDPDAVASALSIDLGGADNTFGVSTLGLTDAELDTITAGVLQIGHAGSPDITITGEIMPAHVSTLDLQTSGAIFGSHTGNDITVTNLALCTGTSIGDVNPIETTVSNLAFANTAGVFNLTNYGSLTIGAVDGRHGQYECLYGRDTHLRGQHFERQRRELLFGGWRDHCQ
ncbi:MAG: hypothetical protein MO846_06340 [Candidatus Devosia symbiotica]|nr:hypothetical protein [Candidatus Devosia symbiotica]